MTVAKNFPQSFEISGCPGNYDVCLQYPGGNEIINCGAIIIDHNLISNYLLIGDSTYWDRLIRRLISCGDASEDFKYESELAKAGLFISGRFCVSDGHLAQQGSIGLAARILLYIRSKWIIEPAAAVYVDQYLCRGCGNCAKICPLIDLRDSGDNRLVSVIERCLCSGCGKCTSVCPTNAIQLAGYGSNDLHSMIRTYLSEVPT
jgi:ferredoxin